MKLKKKQCPYCKKKFLGNEYFNHYFQCKERKTLRKKLRKALFNGYNKKTKLSERTREENEKR